MATSRERCLTEDEMEETMSNPGSDVLSDELLTALDYIIIDSSDGDLPGERQ